MQRSDENFDCLVVGAGPAGSAAAMTLAQAGRRVALVGPARVPRRKVGESLPAAARPLLSRIGFLEVVEAGPHLPCPGNVSSWGTYDLQATDALRDPQGMGWHLNRPAFDRDLRATAVAAGAFDVAGFARHVQRRGGGWTLKAGAGTYAAKWIIDATGRGARIARRYGAVREVDDNLRAFVSYVRPAQSDADCRTLIEAVVDGWWYTARLPDGLRVVVFHTTGSERADPSSTRHVRVVLGGAHWLGAPRVVEACGSALDLPFGNGWVAAGDAALAFDPLSSQGIFNALYSGIRAGEAVSSLLDDRETEAVAYAKRLAEIRQVYLARRAVYYAAETRWAGAPFWSGVQRDLRPPLGQLRESAAVDDFALVQN